MLELKIWNKMVQDISFVGSRAIVVRYQCRMVIGAEIGQVSVSSKHEMVHALHERKGEGGKSAVVKAISQMFY